MSLNCYHTTSLLTSKFPKQIKIFSLSNVIKALILNTRFKVNSLIDIINDQNVVKEVRIYIYFIKKETTRKIFFL